jgi:endonuclease III
VEDYVVNLEKLLDYDSEKFEELKEKQLKEILKGIKPLVRTMMKQVATIENKMNQYQILYDNLLESQNVDEVVQKQKEILEKENKKLRNMVK